MATIDIVTGYVFAWLFLSFKLVYILANISTYVNRFSPSLHVVNTTFMWYCVLPRSCDSL